MTEALAKNDGSRSFLPSPMLWLGICGVFALVAVVLFLYDGVRFGNQTQAEMRLLPYLRYDNRVDFNYFFSGASMAWHGEAAELYPNPGEWTFYPDDPPFLEPHTQYEYARLLARGNYYNPPALAFIEAPMTSLSFRSAFWLFSALSGAAFAGFLFLSWRAGQGIAELPFLLLGVCAFRPVHEALIMGHMALFFVLILTGGFLLLKSERPVLAGLTFSLLALKPQWAILPGIFLLVRGEWRALITMGVAAASIFFVPFFVTGFGTLSNYVHFLRFSADLDIKDAPHMFSWNGFLSKLNGSEIQDGVLIPFSDAPNPLAVYALVGLTAVPLLIIWLSRDYALSVAGTVLAMLLISTHSVWYDWALLVVAALFLILRTREMSRGLRVETWIVLLALYLASSQSIGQLLMPDRHFIEWHRAAFFTITPVAFGSLIWMASLTIRGIEPRPTDAPPDPAAA